MVNCRKGISDSMTETESGSITETEKTETEKHILKIEFDNKDALEEFATWLCESGEQDYWTWMEVQEERLKGDVTATHFNYHNEDKTKAQNDPKRYKGFVTDNTIRTTCGRLDNKQ